MKQFATPTSSVDDIQVIKTRGPWNSKSGGILEVQFGLPREAVIAFLDYENPEFAAVEAASGYDIRGLRSYTVKDIGKSCIGGMEWHLARTEYVTALSGSAVWQCVDFNGKQREFVLDGTTSVVQPPGILHTYKSLEDKTRLQVVCNTLYIPEDPTTHDTYLQNDFYERRAAALIE